jgi:hypothetical protein
MAGRAQTDPLHPAVVIVFPAGHQALPYQGVHRPAGGRDGETEPLGQLVHGRLVIARLQHERQAELRERQFELGGDPHGVGLAELLQMRGKVGQHGGQRVDRGVANYLPERRYINHAIDVSAH